MMICLLVVAMCLGCVGANSNSYDTFFDESAFFSTQNSSITFFSHADWGKGGYDGSQYRRERNLEEKNDEKESNGGEHREETFYQGYTARTMLQVAAMSKPSFVLALGDNFYDDGVNSTTDSMWNTHFRDVYFRSDELRGIPWYSALGNHDLGYGDTGVQAQIDRSTASTADDDGVWSTNGQWYTIQHDIPGGGSVVVVMVDTTWLAPSENEATNEEGGISLDTQAGYFVEVSDGTYVTIVLQWSIVFVVLQQHFSRNTPRAKKRGLPNRKGYALAPCKKKDIKQACRALRATNS